MPNINRAESFDHHHQHIIYCNKANNKTIFFLHGAGGRAAQWRKQIDFFKNNYNIVAPDILGHGESEKPAETRKETFYSFHALSANIQTIFDQYRTDENIIVGHSYGGALATYLTFNKKNRITKMVLLAPTRLKPKVAIGKVFYLPVRILEWIRPLFTEAFAKLAFHPNTDEQLVAQEIAMGKKNPMYVIKPLVMGMKNIPQVDISSIKQPTLVITSDTDGIVPASQSEEFYRWLPNVIFKKIANASHLIMLEQPEQTNRMIKEFLEQ